jgi:signal transduction histidine kinase
LHLKPSFGLRAALTLLVLIAIAPVFAVVVQASLEEQRARLDRAEASLRSVVDLAAAHQEQLVEGTRQMLVAIANAPPVAGDDVRACASYMGKLQVLFPAEYGTFGVLDDAGRLTCRAAAPTSNVVSSDRLFFRRAVETGRFSVGEFIISRASGKPVLAFGMPVYRDNGPLRGVAYVALDVAQAGDQLRKLALLPEMTLLVLDGGGVVIASAGSRPLEIGSRLPGFLRQAMAGGQSRFERARGADGQDWLYALEPVGRPGEGRLFVAGMLSSLDVLAPSARRLQLQLAALLLITLLAAAIAWLFGDRVVARPVARLLGKVQALHREELPLDPPSAAVGTPRELRELEQQMYDVARVLAQRSVQRDGAMAEMEAQNDLLSSILESMAEGVLVIGTTGHFIRANAAALAILPGLAELNRQRAPTEAQAREWGMYELDGTTEVPPQQRPAARALGGETVTNFRYLIRGRLSGGVEKIVQGSARSLSLSGGGRHGAVLVISDITAAWRGEQALKQLNETLERRIDERTRDLAVSNRELESFAYSVSHDLRAPLQVIDGFGRALQARHASRLDGKALHYLERIRENTHQMGALIDDLLSLARVTRTEIVAEWVDLSPRAALAIERLRQRDPQREVVVRIEREIVCRGDPRLLGIVLDNLLENAWKFTERTPQARIEVGRKVGDGGEPVVFVADNGAGFDMAYAGKLFKAFQRLHTSTEFEGTGIGLATVHRIVTRHGGQVWAQAQPGLGAVFQFTLQVGANHEKQPDSFGGGQPGSPGTDPDDPVREQCAQ